MGREFLNLSGDITETKTIPVSKDLNKYISDSLCFFPILYLFINYNLEKFITFLIIYHNVITIIVLKQREQE